MGEALRVGLIGSGARSRGFWGPIVRAFAARGEVEIVGVWSRSGERARALGAALGVPGFDRLDAIRDAGAEAGVVSVRADVNGAIGLEVVDRGMHALLETPIAQSLGETGEIIERAGARGVKVEVAEQFHRRPEEALKRACIEAGLFGRVIGVLNDHEGHGYHGVSLVRHYVGFGVRPTRVSGHERRVETDAGEEFVARAEIAFENGAVATHLWSSQAYLSPIRATRGGRFDATRGCWHTVADWPTRHQLVKVLGADAVRVEREERDGVLTGMRLVADGAGEASWRNPIAEVCEAGWSDDMIATAGCLWSLVRAVRDGVEPSYGAGQARTDMAVCEAIGASASRDGAWVEV